MSRHSVVINEINVISVDQQQADFYCCSLFLLLLIAQDKKAEGPSGDPQSVATQNALAFCDSWSQASFSVDRSLYGGDEALAIAIENAVWVSKLML
jgi:hypothetical protein